MYLMYNHVGFVVFVVLSLFNLLVQHPTLNCFRFFRNNIAAAITYSLVSASITGKFAVDASTGVVTVAAALDYETTTSYTLVVSATDRGAVPLSATTTVSIAVSNVNDNGPICVASVYTATLPENADPATAVVVTVSCPDADTPVRYPLLLFFPSFFHHHLSFHLFI